MLKKPTMKDNLIGYGFLAPALLLLTIFLIIPVIMVIYYAFTDYYLLTPDARQFIGLENFKRLFADPIFVKSIWNTAKFVVWIIPVQLGAALGMALIINKNRKGNIFFKVAFFAPVVMSLVVISILWLYLLNPNEGLVNTLFAKIGIASQPFLTSPKQAMYTLVFVSAWQGAGYQMLLFLGGMQNIPQDVYEAAEIDGFSKFQQFRYITMPLLKPTAIFILLTTLISAFKPNHSANGNDSRWTNEFYYDNGLLHLPNWIYRPYGRLLQLHCVNLYHHDWFNYNCSKKIGKGG